MNKTEFIELLKNNYDEYIEVSYVDVNTSHHQMARFSPVEHGKEYCDITYIDTQKALFYQLTRPLYRGAVFDFIEGLEELVSKGIIIETASQYNADFYKVREEYKAKYNSKVAKVIAQKEKKRKNGVYVIKQGKCVKIGVSTNFQSRLNSMQTASHEILELVCFFEGASYKFESELHKTFDKYWVRGEWFKSKIIPKILEMHSQYSQTHN